MTMDTPTTVSGDVNRDETLNLIASDKVEGTAVYDVKGERIGHIHNFMVNKVTGNVAYAVLSFGGFLGFGEDYFPLPWSKLTYDTAIGGYVVDIDGSMLTDAPRYGLNEDLPSDPDYQRNIDSHWAQPYSILGASRVV